ncbi:MAG: alginate O-acetyltransferase AlgX-related protein [Eubacteriales bacterium]
MYKSKSVSVVCATLFVGVLLSCAVYFGITAIMQRREGADSISRAEGIFFPAFSDSFYDNPNLKKFIGRCEYLLFGSLGSPDIILGKDGFLFDAGAEENGYNYLEDYLGLGRFYELEALANTINMRCLAYKNQGTDYLLVVIPNAQTVYSDYMPSYIGPISGSTNLSLLTAYLSDRGYDFFLNAADALAAARQSDMRAPLYNNTENSLNSLGMGYLFTAVCEKLKTLYGVECSYVDVRAMGLYTGLTDGRTLARRAGLETIIKNRTVSLWDSKAPGYSGENYYGSMVRTRLDEKRLTEANNKTLLLEFTDEWDKIQLMPFFSNTFGEVMYKSNQQYSSIIVRDLQPDIVVQFIHEYELYDLIDPNVTQTYNAGLRLNINPHETSKPICVALIEASEGRFCIAGQTENNAKITISGDNIKTVSQNAVGDLFFIEVDIGESLAETVKITAMVEGKTPSEPVYLRLSRGGVKSRTVAVGKNSELYSSDYSWLNFLSETQLETLRAGLEERIARTRELSGKDTEFIYVIVPDKLAVYPENAPDSLLEVRESVERYKAMAKSLYESAGMTVIDLTRELQNRTLLGRLFYQTDTLWTDFGAYIGYNSLANRIAEKFEGVKVIKPNSFSYTTEETIGGELVTRLGIDGAVISESYLAMTPNPEIYKGVQYAYSGEGGFDIRRAFITYGSDSSLPVAVIMRDAYGTEMLENLAVHFSKMIVLAEGQFSIGDELIAGQKPDYIITIRCNGELS